MRNKLYIAAAGAGKTTKIVEEALEIKDERVLITSYTIANNEQIRTKLMESVSFIPENLTVQTWFSFLLKEGVRPYQGIKFPKRIEGILFVDRQSTRYERKGSRAYYINGKQKIYSDKLSACSIFLDDENAGLVFKRISKRYSYVFVDEIQDLCGYDLEVLKRLMEHNVKIIMVGDPRQCTYTTHPTNKYKRYSDGNIKGFFLEECQHLDIEIDETTLNKNHRSCKPICQFADKIYDVKTPTVSAQETEVEHCGVFKLNRADIPRYLKKYNSDQLRYNRRKEVNDSYPCYNYGESKGLEFDRVLLYPTKSILSWISNSKEEIAPQSKAKFYVAITRAKYSVAIVYDDQKEGDALELPEAFSD